MSQSVAIRLIKSLSSSEKRFFRLHTRLQSGNKHYLDLFDIIDKTGVTDKASINNAFRKKHPGKSLDNSSRYLVKILTDCLIQSKTEKDPLFELLQGIMRAKVLQERSLQEESYQQLKKIREQAHDSQQHFIEYLTYRYELNYLTDSNFQYLNDRGLVEIQMKAKDLLKSLNHIQDHHSLFEIMKYRLLHSGKISSDDDKKQLNDLMLSEMSLVAGKSKNSFAAQKLHLLFQSFFFTDIGDYQSALKTFHALNRLFEQNLQLLDHPPIDYLSALNGILDSLLVLEKHEEMLFYIERVVQLDQPIYPEYFRYQIRKTAVACNLAILTGNKKFDEAVLYIQTINVNILESYNMVMEEKQWELYFYCSLSYFGKKEWKKAHLYAGKIMNSHKAFSQLLICKAMRLLNIMIHYEKGDLDYLKYEINSYKRFFKVHHKLLKSEILLFKFIRTWGILRRKRLPELEYKKIIREISMVQKDKYEKQLLKYFDFTEWIKEKIH